jgi:hypothetical protein
LVRIPPRSLNDQDRAEECRALAGIVTDEGVAKSYLPLAEAYEMLAEEEHKLLAILHQRARRLD